jgi:hypothetical protein
MVRRNCHSVAGSVILFDQKKDDSSPFRPSSSIVPSPADLQRQAQQLREEARAIQRAVNKTREERAQKAISDVDRWIEQLFVNRTYGDTQILNTVEQVMRHLLDDRFSPEQIDKIFDRLCETSSVRGRQSMDTNQLLNLLVEASGKLDCLERDENANKRWNHRVERKLRKKLFAMEWGIDLEEEEDSTRFI